MAKGKENDISPKVLSDMVKAFADLGEDLTEQEKESLLKGAPKKAPAKKKAAVRKESAPAVKKTKTDVEEPAPAVKKTKTPVKDIPEIIGMIRAALVAQGNYTPELDLAINAAAGAYRSYLVAQADMAKLKKTFYLTRTREGNKKYEPHPVIKILKDTHEMTLTSLKALGLTLETLTAVANDPLAEMVQKVKSLK